MRSGQNLDDMRGQRHLFVYITLLCGFMTITV